MSKTMKTQMREVMTLAWQMVKKNGYTMAEALKTAWRNIKLRTQMRQRIVKFFFRKVDGSLREAYGTLRENLIPATAGDDSRKRNDTVQVYWDTERESWRSFKKANLVSVM